MKVECKCGKTYEQKYYWQKLCKECYAPMKEAKRNAELDAPPRVEFLEPQLSNQMIAKLKTCIKRTNYLVPQLFEHQEEIVKFTDWIKNSSFAKIIDEMYGGTDIFVQRVIDENVVYADQFEIRKIDIFSRIKAVVLEYYFRNQLRPVRIFFERKD